MSFITQNCQHYLSQYKKIRQKIQLPLKIKLYFSYLQAGMEQKSSLNNNLKYQQQYLNVKLFQIFSRMSRIQQAYFLYQSILNLSLKASNINQYQLPSGKQLKNVQTDISLHTKMSEYLLGFTYWIQVSFQYKQKKYIEIRNKKMAFRIDLRQYLIRKSQRYQNTIVLEAISEVPLDERKLSFYFQKAVFQKVFKELFSTFIQYRNQQVYKLLLQQFQTNIVEQQSLISKNTRALTFLTPQTIKQSLNYREQIQRLPLVDKFSNFVSIYKTHNCIIQNDKNNQAYYKMQCIFDSLTPKQLKNKFLKKYKQNSYKYSLQKNILEKFSHKYSAVYLKHLFKGQSFEEINQQVLFEEKFDGNSGENVLFLKAINIHGGSSITGNNKLIEFILIKILPKSKSKGNGSKLVLLSKFFIGNNKKQSNLSQTMYSKIYKKFQQTYQIGSSLSIIDIKENQVKTKIIAWMILEFYEMLDREDQGIQVNQSLENGLNIKQKHQQYVKEEREDKEIQNQEQEFHTVLGQFFQTKHIQTICQKESEQEQDNIPQKIENNKKSILQTHKSNDKIIMSKKIQNQEQIMPTLLQQRMPQPPVENLSKPQVESTPAQQTPLSPRFLPIPFKKTQFQKWHRNQYLTHKFILQPTKFSIQNGTQCSTETQNRGDTPQLLLSHYLFSQWTRKSKGGLVCKNSSAVKEQINVMKHIIKTMGQNVFQKKGILNISLPVTIFKAESHLSSIARNFMYAPILMERAVNMNKIQRIKMAILLSISVSAISITVNKPFNPILGETLQCWIDGCPLYLEQISHHPPIASYYFIGRGYKISGCIGSKAKLGIDGLHGWSQEPNYIVFDDGQKIQMNFAKMLIKGIFVGERQFNLTEKIFAYDEKNQIFAELIFGNKKKKQPQDYLDGKIYKLNREYQHKGPSKIVYPKQNQIHEILSQFQGVWSNKITFDGKEYFNFAKQNACIIMDEKFLLPSNANYRKDIQNLKNGNIQLSQKQKHRLEQMQRRDRRLRNIATATSKAPK